MFSRHWGIFNVELFVKAYSIRIGIRECQVWPHTFIKWDEVKYGLLIVFRFSVGKEVEDNSVNPQFLIENLFALFFLQHWRPWRNRRRLHPDPHPKFLHCCDVSYSDQKLFPLFLPWHKINSVCVPSGGLTRIVGTQKWGFSCKVQRLPSADIFLNESLPQKIPQRKRRVHGRHGHGSPVKNRWRFSKFCRKYETSTLTFKMCIL